MGLYFETKASVHTPGSGYVLLHHVMGETHGDRGIWSYVSFLSGFGVYSMTGQCKLANTLPV